MMQTVPVRTRLSTRLTLALMVLSALMTACSRDGTETSTGAEGGLGDPNRINGRLMGELTLLGTVASGQPAPWVRLCAQDRAEGELNPLCTAADGRGDYRMLGLFNQRGILSTNLTDALGNDITLFSFYDISGGTATRANINPTTDVISRVYLFALQNRTGIDCFDEPACIDGLQAGLDAQTLNDIQDNLTTFLGGGWPSEGYQPFAERYVADPSQDPLHQMHSQLDFRHGENANGEPELQVLSYPNENGCTAEELARISYATLAGSPENISPGLTDEQLATASSCALSQEPTPSPFTLSVAADPDRGSSALTSTVSVTLHGAPDNTTLTTSLLNPRGQELAIWTERERNVTLTDAGIYRVMAVARSGTDEATQGIQVEVDVNDSSDEFISWGAAGSCFPPVEQLNSLENTCFEKLDGSVLKPDGSTSTCEVFLERPELTYSPGICSVISQYDGSALGACVYRAAETRIFHYRNQGSALQSETAQQQHDRHRSACTSGSGEWSSLL